jgi:hypothetical protein
LIDWCGNTGWKGSGWKVGPEGWGWDFVIVGKNWNVREKSRRVDRSGGAGRFERTGVVEPRLNGRPRRGEPQVKMAKD